MPENELNANDHSAQEVVFDLESGLTDHHASALLIPKTGGLTAFALLFINGCPVSISTKIHLAHA
jgi:hypothetical protein